MIHSSRDSGRVHELVLSLLFAAGLSACAGPGSAPQENCEPRPQASANVCLAPAASAPRVLLAGQEASAVVDARCRWNHTGVQLAPGGEYAVSKRGEHEDWNDHGVPADLDTGWTERKWFGRLIQGFARAPDLPMYSLVAAQGMDKASFSAAGPAATIATRPAPDGAPRELLLFANDWWSRYDNNNGCLLVTVRRLR